MVEGVAKTAGLLDNLRAITTTIRKVAFRSSLFCIVVGKLLL
jgi:hypothetical protein